MPGLLFAFSVSNKLVLLKDWTEMDVTGSDLISISPDASVIQRSYMCFPGNIRSACDLSQLPIELLPDNGNVAQLLPQNFPLADVLHFVLFLKITFREGHSESGLGSLGTFRCFIQVLTAKHNCVQKQFPNPVAQAENFSPSQFLFSSAALQKHN